MHATGRALTRRAERRCEASRAPQARQDLQSRAESATRPIQPRLVGVRVRLPLPALPPHSPITDCACDSENPEPVFLQTSNPPVLQPFKPAVTVLARKPTPQLLSRNGGMAGLSLDDDDEDSEEERRKKAAADFEERKARAAKERVEKERKYAEARERIFGSPAASEDSRSNSPSKRGGKGARGGRGARESAPRSSNEQSPARTTAPAARLLFEPAYAPKPGSMHAQRREEGAASRPGSRPPTPSLQEKPVREPRGPARGGGRGFGGFAGRGNRGAMAGLS